MKKSFFVIVFLFLCQISIAQENFATSLIKKDWKYLNLIICVDEKIVIDEMYATSIVINNNDTLSKVKDGFYYSPGELLLSPEIWNLLKPKPTGKQRNNTQLFLRFMYYKDPGNMKSKTYDYEIEFFPAWFDNLSFCIVYIYNLDNRKYRKKYYPLSKDKNYTYELSSSNGQMLRVGKSH